MNSDDVGHPDQLGVRIDESDAALPRMRPPIRERRVHFVVRLIGRRRFAVHRPEVLGVAREELLERHDVVVAEHYRTGTRRVEQRR